MLDTAPGTAAPASAEASAPAAPAPAPVPAPVAAPETEAQPPGELDHLFAASPPATGAPVGGEAGARVSAPAATLAAPQPWEAQMAQVQQIGGQLVTAYQQLQAEEAAAQGLMRSYGGNIPAETLQSLQRDQQQRVQAYMEIQRAANQLELARGQALLAQRESQFRTAYEPAAETFTITELVAAAQRNDPSVDGTKMRAYLKGFGADAIVPAAQKYFALHRDGALGTRAARGTDRMGGPGGAAGALDFAKMSETDLYKLGIEQSERKAAKRA